MLAWSSAACAADDLRLRLQQLILVLVLLDREQKIAFFHRLAVLVVNLLEIALDASDQLDIVDRRGVAGDLDIIGHRLQSRQHDRDRRRCARRRQLRPRRSRTLRGA